VFDQLLLTKTSEWEESGLAADASVVIEPVFKVD
jgi:hypothetical protein